MYQTEELFSLHSIPSLSLCRGVNCEDFFLNSRGFFRDHFSFAVQTLHCEVKVIIIFNFLISFISYAIFYAIFYAISYVIIENIDFNSLKVRQHIFAFQQSRNNLSVVFVLDVMFVCSSDV
jgi:hypothetical protein